MFSVRRAKPECCLNSDVSPFSDLSAEVFQACEACGKVNKTRKQHNVHTACFLYRLVFSAFFKNTFLLSQKKHKTCSQNNELAETGQNSSKKKYLRKQKLLQISVKGI